MKLKIRSKKWPYWKRSNTALFLGGLAAYVVGFAFLCTCNDARFVFLTLSLVAGGGFTCLNWFIINTKDNYEE